MSDVVLDVASEQVAHSRVAKERRRRWIIFGLVTLVLALGAVINLIPFAWMLSTSLKSNSQAFSYPPTWIPNPFVWQNYVDAYQRVNGRVFFNTAFFAISIVVLQGMFATMGGFAFARVDFPYRNIIFLIYLGTMMIPPQVTLIPTYIVVVNFGWVNTYQGMILPIVAQGAFGTFLFRQFFLRLPNEMYEAARLDGANYWQQFWTFTLPLARPVITAYSIITFLTAWKMYLWPLIVVRSPDLKVLPMAIAELSGNASQDRGVMMAAVALSILPILILYVLAQRWFVEGIAMSGQKG
ncbi:MAG TPA: carbohydrate ABC transporter permease [Thermomicrobiales bacterium]|nr:carbohydrate ABC transporter permease [Thermomicrobiales bacterium]